MPSYIEALEEGMIAARHKTRDDEKEMLLSGDETAWLKFTHTCVNGRDADNYCLEDLFWLTRDDLFIGFISLRRDMGPIRTTYGGNTGRELRPSERNKGYGTIGLKLTKEVARQRGYPFLEMVTACDNMAAIRPWEKCGGVFVERFETPPQSYYTGAAVKYRIDLSGVA